MMTSNRRNPVFVRIVLLLAVLILSAARPIVGQASPALTLRIEEDSTQPDAEGFALIVVKLIFAFDRNVGRADIESLFLKANATDISRLATPSANWMSLNRRTLCLSLTLPSVIALTRIDMETSQFEATLRLKGSASALEARAGYSFLEHKEVPPGPKPAEPGREKTSSKTAGASSPSAASAKPKTGTIVAGPWLPDTPDDAGLWNKRDTPWRKGEILVSGPSMPANLEVVSAEAVDYGKLSPEEYRAAVAMVMESMRLIYGDMSPSEEQRFQAKWAPLMDFPTPTAVHYFNVLGPLLSQFIDLRSAIVSLGLQFDEVWSQAGVAAGFENEDAVAESIARAQRLREQMSSLKGRMEEVVTRIKALGDPPNPFAARHRARKALDQAVESLPKPAEAANPGSYVLIDVRANVHPAPPRMHGADGEMEATKVEYSGSTITKQTTFRDVGDDYKFGTALESAFKISWSAPLQESARTNVWKSRQKWRSLGASATRKNFRDGGVYGSLSWMFFTSS